jgi:hypothetical protein
MAQMNLFGDLSGIAQNIQDHAIFVVRELGTMQGLVTMFTDASGGNPRTGYKYNQGVAKVVGDGDDLTSDAFTPSADQTLTPFEIAEQFFISDLRAESQAPESIIRDGALELGYAGLDKVESDLVSDMASLTGGTIGTAGSVITWGYVSAAIAVARNVNKSANKPLSCVLHGYQAAVLAKTASVAGATSIAQAPQFTDEVTKNGLKKVFTFMGVPIYQVFAAPDSGDDFTGGVFPKEALAIDWRRAIRIRPQRDESRRGAEFNMSAVYAHGVWRPTRGVKMIFDATAPTS